MRTFLFSFLFLFISFNIVFSQNSNERTETRQLIKTRNYYLNGGARSVFGSGKSRVYLKLDLPKNTIKWYYGFTTSKGKSGIKNLNLAIQLASLFADPSAVTSGIISKVKVPEGVAVADIFLFDRENLDIFYRKGDLNGESLSYFIEGTTKNTKSGIIEIDDINSGTVYLGIKNPKRLTGVNVSIEVVAIVKENIPDDPDKIKSAELYGGLGWSQFLEGNYLKCIELSNKSIAQYELGWVYGNKALATLMLGNESESTDLYVKAINLVNKQPNSNYIFRELIKDIYNAKKINPNLTGADGIKTILISQIKQ
jgi:hypothetical protein